MDKDHTMQTQPQQQRLLDMYAAVLACDQVIIRSTGKVAMFEAVCDILVATGGLQLAWIGMLDAGDQRIWPQAHSGEGWNTLDWMRSISDVSTLSDQGMVGAVVEQGRAIWSDDVQHDVRDDVRGAPPTEELRQWPPSGPWHSTAAIPLVLGERVCGVLSVYSLDAAAFDDRIRSLLLQLADNISAALKVLDRAAQRELGEFALMESEVRYNALFASNPMPMLVIDPSDGRIVDANIRAMNFYGWNHSTITTKFIQDINVQTPEEVQAAMTRLATAEGSHQDSRHRLANGEVRDVEAFTSPLSFKGQTYVVKAIHDVTERHMLEAKVHQSQQLMQRFIDQLPGTAFVKDSNLRLLMANRQLGVLLGVDPATLIGKTAHDIFPQDFADFVTLLDREVLDAGEHRVFEETFQDRHNETSMFVIDDGGGQRFLAGLSLDITDRYRAKERTAALLRINELAGELPERKFLTAGLELAEKLTNSKIGFLHFVNEDQETLELVTWTAGALKGCTAAFDAHYPVSQAGIWADSMRTRAPVIFNDYANQSVKKGLPPGHAPMTRLISVPVTEGGLVRMMLGVGNKATHYAGFDVETLQLIGNDLWRIARRGRLEASLKHRVDELVEANQRLSDMQLQLLQSEKMATIGQLASGVAHEINNPIGFVKSNLGSLAGYVKSILEIVRAYEDVEHIHGDAVAQALLNIEQRKKEIDYAFLVEDVSKLIDESIEGVQRVSQIVADLKNFSRTGDAKPEPADLQAGIESTINVVWNQLKYKVNVVREYVPLPSVSCVASQINQVVMNLLTNAEQAITERGTITVRTGVDTDTVWFEVQDTGCGIALDKLARIFEPFYTSKPVGQGTGLGLSISFGIVQRHGGSITVKSAPDVGSTFRVTLPISRAATDEVEP
jgi:PAS domain S-box-containing protein